MGLRKNKNGHSQLLVKSSAGTGLKHKARHHVDVVTNLPIPTAPPRAHFAIRPAIAIPKLIPTVSAVSTGMRSVRKTEVIHELLHRFGYVPMNKTVYTAAYSGCISGFVGSSRDLQDPTSTDYVGFAQIAGAFAKSFDIEWGAGAPDTLQVFIIEKTCKAVWESRDVNVNATTLDTASFTNLCQSIIALVAESEVYFATQSIVPDAWPGGGGGSGTVTSVTAGPGISVTGTPTIAPVVNNTGVLSVAAGTNVTVTGTAQNPIVNASGGTAGTLATAATGAQSITGATYSLTASNSCVRLRYTLTGKVTSGGPATMRMEGGEIFVENTAGVLSLVNASLTSSILLGVPSQYEFTTAVIPPYISVTLVGTVIQFQVSPDNATATDWEIHITGDAI